MKAIILTQGGLTGKDLEELNAQWYDYENYWDGIHKQTSKIDDLIKKFNTRSGLLK